MRYTYRCSYCTNIQVFDRTMAEGPPGEKVECNCGHEAIRYWKADAPMIDTSACRDHSELKPEFRTRSVWDGNKSPHKVESEFRRDIEEKRKLKREAGKSGRFKQTMSVPSHLYHGKKRETGDPNYWDDPNNRKRHGDCII